MITMEALLSIEKHGLENSAAAMCAEDLPRLVEWLSEKDDAVRYPALQLLWYRAGAFADVYPYWDVFCGKLKSDNSYQRSIGLMLIADNAKWDEENRLDGIIEEYLLLLKDDKPITVRQCIQALGRIAPYKPNLHRRIADGLMAIDLSGVKETIRKLILLDILNVLVAIGKYGANDKIEGYILNALSGDILDKKAKKQVELML